MYVKQAHLLCKTIVFIKIILKPPFPFLDHLTFDLKNAILLLQINHYKVPAIFYVNYYNLSFGGIAVTNKPVWPLLWQLLKSHAGILQGQPVWPTNIIQGKNADHDSALKPESEVIKDLLNAHASFFFFF